MAKFIESLPVVNYIRIERRIMMPNASVFKLHGFCDAPDKSYGAAIYIKSTTTLGEIKGNLMTSKSRVAHLKQISIPRLKLCGAVLVTELTKKVKQALEIEKADIHFWTDSTIVISLI
ncbi:hypothetical protein AVEN_56933-1 [Araneus ventricosus]|uniref:RNase H type-1 domain-containing protein n=1 Tax=Araneus ventricosus TaxID=182803 RepID=A0A4Y2EV08_ARAVE|nr:hypothetical protein AVEN_56933-1 [Araneus ventricosus]